MPETLYASFSEPFIKLTKFYMKKNSFVFIILFFQVTMTLAQDNKKSEISLSFGPAFAIGKFANTDLFNNSSGFAKSGEIISASYLHPFSKNWKFIVNLSGQRNPINTNAFETTFSTAKIYQGFTFSSDPDNPPLQTNYAVYPNWHFDKKSWLLGSLQIGALRQFSTSGQNKLSPAIKATAGAVYASSPLLKGRSVTDTATAVIEQSKSSRIGLVYTIGGSVNYSLTKRVFLFTVLDYCGTNNLKFKDIKSTLTTTKGTFGSPDYSIQQTVITTEGKQTISSINLLFGISLVL